MSHSCVCDTFNTDADMNNDGYRIQLFSCFSDKRERKKKKKEEITFPYFFVATFCDHSGGNLKAKLTQTGALTATVSGR